MFTEAVKYGEWVVGRFFSSPSLPYTNTPTYHPPFFPKILNSSIRTARRKRNPFGSFAAMDYGFGAFRPVLRRTGNKKRMKIYFRFRFTSGGNGGKIENVSTPGHRLIPHQSFSEFPLSACPGSSKRILTDIRPPPPPGGFALNWTPGGQPDPAQSETLAAEAAR